MLRRKEGYWPTTYMMQEAITALFSFPFLCSQSCSSVRRVLMKNDRSSRSWMLPQSDPTIHERELRVS